MLASKIQIHTVTHRIPDRQMVIFRTLFVSGFQMVAAILFLPFEIRTGYFLPSLDRLKYF
jgi:hypothetical protein